jgi:hypothetical protein
MGNYGLFVVIAPSWIAIRENKKIVYNIGLKKMKILRKLNILRSSLFFIFYLPFSNNKSWRMDGKGKNGINNV